MNGFILAGTNSGCGKTTITLGLMSLLKKQGLKVAPFKAGPDFIDPAFHQKATGVHSYNLDSHLVSHDMLRTHFLEKTAGKDIAVVEGVMGLFDGMGEQSEGSAADLSRILNLPVILAVNCKGASQSVVATVHGFATLDPSVKIAGVILNHVPNHEHYLFLKKMIESKTGVVCIGYLPTRPDVVLESRHLGLIQATEVDSLNEKIDNLTTLFELTIDHDSLLKVTRLPEVSSFDNKDAFAKWHRDLAGLRVGVAKDEAFSFYYKSNLELLELHGAELVYFSPLHDKNIPIKANALYIGGGYPEVYASGLSANNKMLDSLKEAAETGLPIYAECGGLMYLTENIRLLSGECIPMTGIFNSTSAMTKRLQRFGYCSVQLDGAETRAHEFHHSEQLTPDEPNFELAYQVTKASNGRRWSCGLHRKNVLAAYAHVQFLSSPSFYHKIIDLWTKQNTPF
ncbi:cobyrinate a,c-diamide synthase [Parabacteroides sp. FAFU027]|uniref:cobyrinate a,c-diamide synthase n=1 Tax=Parabacteroides sp. FAFU027 TaxID=2922715 RepID=UPI001FAF355D|nr:cobyrinate a,c-diamide synthase [Parabacteroides sp. FAFU027]